MGREDDYDGRLTSEETEAITRLLQAGLPDDDEPTMVGPSPGVGADPIVLRYDLVAGTRRRHDDLPGLQIIHERFARELGGEFRRAVGREGSFFAERLRHARFAELYANLEVPSALLVCSFTGLGCSILVNMDVELMLHFLDILMGGRGGRVTIPGDLALRGFTPTERGLIAHLVAILSRALGTGWSDVTRVSLELTRVATDPRHAAIYAPGEAMVEQRLSVEWGEVRGAIQLIIPTTYLRQYDSHLSRTAPPDRARADPRDTEHLRVGLGPVEVELEAVLGHAKLTVEALLNLAVGDVIRLDADPDATVEVLIEGHPKFRAYPTTSHGNVAVKIDSHIEPAPGDQR